MEQSRRYLFAKEPTSTQLHALAHSFADMLSCDCGVRVSVKIDSVSIIRDPLAAR
ncbi:hypothetical protein [Paraburkholderia sp. Ac-20347]|uniref:hypothetical protein n=1 Tax=Paraburkholderia sp. Ac-20347 TaxID=2703892 RepID=UPI00197EA4B0|nr:hypothetical protein [Paraburkholderia sp. Ac-20347]MBN3811669.1 hypothetical protein [Paraburkholderia sp. Ac-20347]